MDVAVQVERARDAFARQAWSDAYAVLSEVDREQPRRALLGMALYQEAELYRVRGAFARSEETYRQVGACGHRAQPGLALLWPAQDRVDAAAAAAAIRSALDELPDRLRRARLLAPYVEIMLAADDLPAARAAADELARTAADLDAPLLHAVAAHARGAVLLAEGEAAAALDALLEAGRIWDEIEAPYEREKTVARHLSNIFGKLGLSSRAAATAYAYEHDLVGQRWAE